MKIAIILPAYNEETTVQDVIKDFHTHCPQAAIYVIDNNSNDKTAELARQTIAELGCKGEVWFEPRQGKANAVRLAFHKIDADIIVLADADLTYPAKHLPQLLEPIKQGDADVVVGNRHETGAYQRENKRPLHNFGNRLISYMINTIFKAKLDDIMSGYRVLTRRFIKNYPIMCSGFEIETEMSLHIVDKRFRIIEIPIDYVDRPDGSASKLNTLQDGFRVIYTVLQIFRYYRPLAFFGMLALLCFLIGIAVGTPVVIEFVRYQYIFAVPKAILATGLMIFGLVMLSIGLNLDSVVRNHKFDYEVKLMNYEA